VRAETLLREVERLEARRPSRTRIPSGPIELARAAGIEKLDS
jgi:hypothetical protein